jgi:peptidoglycan hydrolase CwlO-like protein
MGRRGFTVLVTAALAVGPLALPAHADSLNQIERRLNALERKITLAQNSALNYQLQLAELSGQVAEEQGNLAEIDANLASTTERATGTRAGLEHAREQIHARARALYKRGGALDVFGVLLGAESMDDFIGRVSYAKTVTDRDAGLISEMQTRSDELRHVQSYQRLLRADRTNTVRFLKRRQEDVADVFARQQDVLADLARTRAEALDFIERMGVKLGPGALAALRRVAGQGMTITYGGWAKDFLSAIGAPAARNNLIVMVAWEAAEGTQATWNPLATTMDDEGATDFNSVGVKNYVSEERGIAATIRTLRVKGYGYERVLDGLERGLDPMKTAHRIQQSRWCHGCAEGGYVIGIVPAVQKYYEDYAAN